MCATDEESVRVVTWNKTNYHLFKNFLNQMIFLSINNDINLIFFSGDFIYLNVYARNTSVSNCLRNFSHNIDILLSVNG